MACKICGEQAAYDLVCEKGCGVAAQICSGPMCQFDLWRVRPNEAPSVIPLMNGKCRCNANLHQVTTGSSYLAFRFDTSNKPVFHAGYHTVEACTEMQIVQDAQALQAAWEDEAKRIRGMQWESPNTEGHECSTGKWNHIDEGMDVAKSIAEDGENGAGATLWRVKDHRTGKVIGVLVLDSVEDVINSLTYYSEDNKDPFPRDGFYSGIRKVVGHPNGKGAGEALMAKADEMHRASGVKYMTVIAAMSAVKWYKDRGFFAIALSDCNGVGRACGCVIMIKPRPDPLDFVP